MLHFYKNKEVVDLIKSTKKEVDFLFRPCDAFNVYALARAQSALNGDMAEVGVYQGGSAKLICEAKGNKTLHLFDTFDGLPDVSEVDKQFNAITFFQKNQYKTDFQAVKEYLSAYKNVQFYKGFFPKTAIPVKAKKFSFVHLDVDLYQSTLDCRKFFYPRMIKGGIIISHDYHAYGVRKAFEEFCKDKKEPILELAESQCMIVRT